MLNNKSVFWQEHAQPFGKEGDSDSYDVISYVIKKVKNTDSKLAGTESHG